MLKVRSRTGEMVPLSALMSVKPAAGAERAMRYNGFLSADINGDGRFDFAIDLGGAKALVTDFLL